MPAQFPGNSVTKAARAASGGGFESAIEVASGEASLTGTVAHGSTVTLSDPESRLGTRSNTPFRHWQVGSEIILNGTASTAESGASIPDTTEVWGGVSDDVDIVTDNLRHARIDQQYRALGKGSLTSAKAFSSISVENKFYFAKWANPGSSFGRTYVLGYSGLTGTFNTNANRTRGEAVTISLVGGGTKTGYITGLINSVLTLEITGGSGGAPVIEGATVTGGASGATVTIDTTTYGSAASTKIVRSYNGGVPSSQGISVVTSHNGGIIDVDEYGSSGYIGSLANDYSGIVYSDSPNEWHLYELEIDFTGASGVVRQRIDNSTIYTVSGLDKTNLSDVVGFVLSNVGMDTPGLPVSFSDIGMSEDWGEIVADNDLKRLVIGDAPVLSDCTQIEVQRHTTWGSSEVQFVVNQGGFSALSGKYLFAVDGGYSELLQVAL